MVLEMAASEKGCGYLILSYLGEKWGLVTVGTTLSLSATLVVSASDIKAKPHSVGVINSSGVLGYFLQLNGRRLYMAQ